MNTHHTDVSLIYARHILTRLLVCALICVSAQAQSNIAPGGASSSIDSALAITDPAARIAALQRFLEPNNSREQIQTAREGIVTSYAQLADGALGESSVERAMENFRQAITMMPDRVTDRFFEETVSRIPFALSLRGYRNEAIEIARVLEERFAKDPPRLASIGEFYMTIEAAGDAIHALEMAAKISGEDARLRRLLGSAYRMGLRLDDAIAEFQLAVSFDAKDKRAYYELANLYRAQGAYADAIKLYRKQLEIEPKHTSSYKGLALAYLAQGNEDQMTAALNQARDLRGSAEEVTGDIYLQTQLSFYYLAKKKLKEARQAAEAALRVEPRYSWARIAAAEVDLASGKYFEAERNLIAARSYAGFPTLFFTLGKVYLVVEDFDSALEQFSKAFTYSPQKQFTTRLGGVYDAQADNLKELLAREHQAAIFLAEPPTSEEIFRIIESLVRFNIRVRATKISMNSPSAGGKDAAKNGGPSVETWREQMVALDQAAMDFVEAENSRRSFRMLHIAGQLAQSGVATGLAVELAEQAFGLAEAATELDGSLREYPNYNRDGRLAIFRGRALSAKGWALFKAGKNQEAVAALTESVKSYGSLPESRRALWRLATVKETQGELKEALEFYIAGYEPPASGSEIDFNRGLIESLYRKVNGSLEGLNSRLGLPEASSIATSPVTPAPAATTPGARTNPSVAKAAAKSNARKTPAKSDAKPDTSAGAAGAAVEKIRRAASEAPNAPPHAKNQPVTSQPVSTPTPPASKRIKLPSINRAQPAIPFAPLSDFNSVLPKIESLSEPTAITNEPPPTPPEPKVHTRKRRATAPDNQQREQ